MTDRQYRHLRAAALRLIVSAVAAYPRMSRRARRRCRAAGTELLQHLDACLESSQAGFVLNSKGELVCRQSSPSASPNRDS
jgi:hypothetical protein